MELRPYQVQGIDRTLALLRSGKRRVCVVAPTGAGKTVILSEFVRRHRLNPKGGRVLVGVHRGELVTQTQAKLIAAGLDVGIVAAGRDARHDLPVLVASIQTMLARSIWPDGITLLILDEAHHYVADEWKKVAEHYPNVYVLGFTATPERGDGSALGDIFDAMVVVAQTKELIDLGHLCPIDWVGPERRTRDDCEEPIEAWTKHARGKSAVMFCPSVESAQKLAADINAREDRPAAAAIWGDMKIDTRHAALSSFARGELDCLTNVFVLTEGWDCPRAEVCIIARGCDHVGTYLQMVGRVLRPFPGKARALCVDLRGVAADHGFPDELRQFSLDGKAISGAAPTKDCPECGYECHLAARLCPECRYEFPIRPRALDIAPMTRMTADERERLAFKRALFEARERGWSDGWAVKVFLKRFGRRPWKLWKEFGCRSKKDLDLTAIDETTGEVAPW